ncbi:MULTISPECIES: flagellar basal body P-ring formation chaperone FlgA [Diaphorobacter]|uniref:Flagella basal body P-ring formation protein FlgA n=1 Tax=Diaphorobacter nitroreducens TaxID=164759 RepID=A0AAX1WPK1_9BURK|nr:MULTISPECIES: flagellar basal body P-ring formation chaperone FlgA [Diaphorobacter]TFI44795.1 flagellar basal body P-ring formation protein FlgA [Diaphorobacter sp. DS2]MBV2217231.1 flagellar basal body P-ring formation protein FlgA [Diaphorobacter sp.]QPN30148.1 flagellar basal body P-ring formation protein FlgA [Diaphorobacter sp. JS3051]ROR39250.1 flagella basal body P-ring formation protein FlgA [Diaphorobacter nitroreducens]WKK88603.1 flagellar basal body P-ring formation chaperone Flg
MPLPILRSSRLACLRFLMGGALALGSALALPAHAQQGGDQTAELGSITQHWLDDALAQAQAGGLPLRMEVSVGTLDSRLRLAPCARVEPYLPAGARLWGRTRLGLRCVDGPTRWNVFLPITVKAFGPAWVLAGNVGTGAVLSEQDAIEAEVDWAAEPAAIVANPKDWVGQTATRPLSAGQALRQNMVRAPDLFKAGSAVRVVVQGPGYAVTSSGQAMSAGAQGQNVRVRMANGRIIGGTVLEDGTIEATL